MSRARELRVLILGDHFGYAGGVVHGVTSYYLNVLPRLRDAGADVRCCFLREVHPAAAQLVAKGIPVEFLSAMKWNPFVLGRVERLARDMDANVLHVASMKSAALGRIVARRLGAALFIHSHDLNLPPLPGRLLYRFLRKRDERGLAVSAAAADYMDRAYGIPRSAVTVLPNAIDVQAIQSLERGPAPPGVPAEGSCIVWAGRLHDVKGPQRMIRIMAKLAVERPGLQLVMAGNGPERESCDRLVQSLGLQERVHLVGQRDDLPRIFQHAEMLCITSFNEGFSLVAAEAAASGVPVVAYAVGGIAEVVRDGVTGVLVTDGDEAAFTAAVKTLLDDKPLRLRMGAQAAIHALRFGMQEHVDLLLSEYRSALATASATPPAGSRGAIA